MFSFDATKWAKTRALGRNHFILLYGVLAWGIPMAIFFTLRQAQEHGWQDLWIDGIVSMIVFPIAGIFFGLGLWKFTEWRFAKATSDVTKS